MLGATVATVAYWRRALSASGAIGATLVGAITFARGGMPAAAALLAFFVSSSALSRVAMQRKERLPLAQTKGAQRDVWQVLANGGAATLCVLLGKRSGLVGALAAAAADTWATELGMLARRPPRLITTLRTVEPGTSGGITPEGVLASLGGAMAVGVAAAAFRGERHGIPRAVVAGMLGSLVDSVLGATLQASYACDVCGQPTEEPIHARCGSPTRRVRGYRWVTNDVVNAIATGCGALIALV